jgi:hypothetical protein
MSFGLYGILIIFGLFVLLMFINPSLSCFGRRLKSPFYPLFRGREIKRRAQKKQEMLAKKDAPQKAEDYGFHLD